MIGTICSARRKQLVGPGGDRPQGQGSRRTSGHCTPGPPTFFRIHEAPFFPPEVEEITRLRPCLKSNSITEQLLLANGAPPYARCPVVSELVSLVFDHKELVTKQISPPRQG